MSTHHEEFPELTPEARAALDAALNAITSTTITISLKDLRRALAALLREALKQAGLGPILAFSPNSITAKLFAIPDNLHSPPPPPPTLAEAREADLDTPEGKAAVRVFLASLGK